MWFRREQQDTDMYGDGEHFVGSDLYRASGTSMAAPHVAGACALLLREAPEFSSYQVQSALMQNGVNLNQDLF